MKIHINDYVSFEVSDGTDVVRVSLCDTYILLYKHELNALVKLWLEYRSKPEDKYMTMTDVRHMDATQVQFVLDMKTPEDDLCVIFTKVDGTQRKITGKLIPSNGVRKENVPIDTPDGIKSFNINRVLFLA